MSTKDLEKTDAEAVNAERVAFTGDGRHDLEDWCADLPFEVRKKIASGEVTVTEEGLLFLNNPKESKNKEALTLEDRLFRRDYWTIDDFIDACLVSLGSYFRAFDLASIREQIEESILTDIHEVKGEAYFELAGNRVRYLKMQARHFDYMIRVLEIPIRVWFSYAIKRIFSVSSEYARDLHVFGLYHDFDAESDSVDPVGVCYEIPTKTRKRLVALGCDLSMVRCSGRKLSILDAYKDDDRTPGADDIPESTEAKSGAEAVPISPADVDTEEVGTYRVDDCGNQKVVPVTVGDMKALFDPNHPNYSRRLAIAVAVWASYKDDSNFRNVSQDAMVQGRIKNVSVDDAEKSVDERKNIAYMVCIRGRGRTTKSKE